MKNLWRIVFVMVMSIIVGTGNSIGAGAEKNDQKTSGNEAVRVAVIGGMTMTGLWQEIAEMFREESGYCVTVVKTGQRPALA
ncbi:MAG: ABC transporter substrate-binding protein, partial [Deltaproteobacteria bacterium]|nr:ABC transporter substrate-binding protein [Deltaproteobacteria bacterium]